MDIPCDVWNMDIPWTTLVSRHKNLIKEKEGSTQLGSTPCTYQEALKKIEIMWKERVTGRDQKEDAKN